ncbi:hypothetical protein BKA66DRAFT_468977 [Pyrenochaeta sp. MPI-SDFR-AT-0127]|nr:hypothetical protein BKA66DRAFT_468977 [Pyrenochaeta sp. MPI-SDFR-AT-0127]
MSRASTTVTSSTTATSTISDLPPDVAKSRAARINNELISLFKRPCRPNSTPAAKGIGLYTHVEGPTKTPRFPHEKYLKVEPRFLPLGGPRKVGKARGSGSRVDNEVKRVWHELREAMLEEERIARAPGLSTEELMKRYGLAGYKRKIRLVAARSNHATT